MNIKSLLLSAVLGLASSSALAQLSINALNTNYTIDFTGFTAPSEWAAASPGTGQLDSNIWHYGQGTRTQVASTFGGSQTGGQGTSTGGVTTGGVYAFNVGSGNIALGIQPTGSNPWSGPQSFTFRAKNNTSSTITSISIDYSIFVRNDQSRANELYFYWSTTNDGTANSYTRINALDYTSPGAADATPSWVQNDRSTTITGLSLAPASMIYFRFGLNDSSGSGSRDEFAIDNIRVNAIPEPGTLVMVGVMGLAAMVGLKRRRK